MAATMRACEVCGNPIDPERLEALPNTYLCITCAKGADKLGGEFKLGMSFDQTSKAGSLKKNYGGITSELVYDEGVIQKLKTARNRQKDQAVPKPAAPEKKVKEKQAATPFDRDAMGSRRGSQSAQINAVLSQDARSVEQLSQSSGLPTARIRSHLAWLLARGYVEEVDRKWRLKTS